MPSLRRKRAPEFSALLSLMEVVSVLGVIYILLVLARQQSIIPIQREILVLYGVWFLVSGVSVYGILKWKKWGVYALAASTAVVTVVDVLRGTASLGGASLGLVVVVVLAVYLRPIWEDFE